MNKKQVVDDVTLYLEPILEEHAYELVDVEFVKEGPTYYLRIYIDKDGGITIQDCEIISKTVEPVLDEKDPIKEPYMLEVSSPGLDRILKKDKDFDRFAGSVIDVKLYKAVDKQKQIQGTLVKKTEDKLILEVEDGSPLELDYQNVAMVRLAILF
ncbi:MAG: ribosome maturation factor RimP [Cellulosilyticaceae bacterium]